METQQLNTAATVPSDEAKLTRTQAIAQMIWVDLGQTNNIQTHALKFYESVSCMESKTGEMRYGTVWRYAGEKIWRVETLDGVSLRCEGLASAKVSALDLAIARLERDGYVQCIPEAEKVDEGEVIRCFVRVIGEATDPDDVGIEGIYLVEVHTTRHLDLELVTEREREEIANAVLNEFHERQGIEVLDDFNISVHLSDGSTIENESDEVDRQLVRKADYCGMISESESPVLMRFRCPNCGESSPHEDDACVLNAFIGLLRDRGIHKEHQLEKLHAYCDVSRLWDTLNGVLDDLGNGHYMDRQVVEDSSSSGD